MALAATTIWEVRTGGSDTNGGGYVSGGTDWSQQDAAQYSVTDGVTAGTTTITSATATFGTDVVGNLVYVQGGTGAVVADWYQIISRTNATTIVVDRSTGLTAGTGVTLKIGGALLSPAIAASKYVAGNTIYVKSGTYSITSATTNIAGGCVSLGVAGNGTTNIVRLIGYGTTRGDNGTKPLLQASGISTATLITANASFMVVDNIEVNGNSLTSIRGISLSGSATQAIRCKARNCTNSGIFVNTNADAWLCEATGCSTQAALLTATGSRLFGCVAHTNTITGISSAGDLNAAFCLSYNNTGASSDGFSVAARGLIANCVSYGNGRDGFRLPASHPTLFNCISYGNSAWGYNAASAAAMPLLVNCAGGSNTSGNVGSNLGRATEGFVILTANPFTTPASGDFSLNNTSGGGSALRATGIPGVFPGGLSTGYIDIGAVQHQDSGGGGGCSMFKSGMIQGVAA